MERRPFGRTGLAVPILGFGAGHVGDPALDEAEVGRLLHGALDLGVTLIDTARSYGLSEERIGRHLAGRNQDRCHGLQRNLFRGTCSGGP
jgi:aryl-alcohol dehydrogenase-like predicted oxidoreductase